MRLERNSQTLFKLVVKEIIREVSCTVVKEITKKIHITFWMQSNCKYKIQNNYRNSKKKIQKRIL